MADRIVIDIGILQGIFGDLNKLQQQLGGLSGGVADFDKATSQAFSSVTQSTRGVQGAVAGLENGVDAGMRNIVADIMGPVAKTQELEDKLRRLGNQVRTSRSVSEITKLKKEIAATQRELDGVNPGSMEKKVGGAAGRMRGMLGSMVAPLAGAFAVSGIAAFTTDLAKMAGASQQFDASLKNMLQSKERADVLAAQVKTFAATTPFELPELQDATKKMLAFGFGAEETIPTLRKLGDVAAGLGQPVGDLAYLYGTTRVQGRLYTNDLMQFANRGIPIIEELSKVLGVSQSEVKALVEKGKVGFPQVEQVFANLTAEGSKFGGLMAAQSGTITGQMSNLSDAWGQFKTELGLALAPLITNVVSGLSSGIEYLRDTFEWVKENGPLVRGVLTAIAIAVGIYTAAISVNSAATFYNTLLQKGAMAALGLQTMWTTLSSAAVSVATVAQWAWNAALNANPIGLVVLAIAGLVAAVVYAWNNFEGFRAMLYGVWEAAQVVFDGIVEVVKVAFSGIIDMARGVGTVLEGVFSGDFGKIKEGFKQFGSGVVDNFTAPVRAVKAAVDQAQKVGKQVGEAYAIGDAKGRADFRADKKDEAAKEQAAQRRTAGVVTAQDLVPPVPGQNVGAAGLVGGIAPPAPGSSTGKKDGVTVGGSEGSGRTITMNIKMTNTFNVPKDANMGAREAAERIVGALVGKLNDAQYAMG